MVVIYAEKADLGSKIAAAIDKITLKDGTIVTFANLGKEAKKVKAHQNEFGYFKCTLNGEECYVTWGSGHLCALKEERDYNPDYANWRNLPLPFFPAMELKPNSSPIPQLDKKLKFQIKVAKDLFFKADYIINAADNDREGELLFAYFYEYIKCKKPVKRVFLSSYTGSGIKKAFQNLVDGSKRANVVAAGRARSHADFLIGTNITTALTLANPKCGVISAGRVQTTALNMLVELELAIRNFKPEDYFVVESEFTTKSGETYVGVHGKFKTKEEAEKITKALGTSGTVTDVTVTKSTKEAPELYNQAALQMDANAAYGYTLNETLEAAQKLYEGGYSTYARTSSRYLNNDKKDDIRKLADILEKSSATYAAMLGGRRDIPHEENYFDDSKVGSHFAIIPTGKMPSSLSDREQKVYDLIARSVIRMFLDDAVYDKTKLVTTVDGIEFTTNGTAISHKGWLEATVAKSKETILPTLTKGEVVKSAVRIVEKKTQPPKRYTDQTFVKALLTAGKDLDDKELRAIMANPLNPGIGTEATRAHMLETLINREYVKREKKTLIATDKGINVIQAIPIEELKSPEMTAKWEQRLINIESGKDSFDSFVNDTKKNIETWLPLIKGSSALSSASKNSVGKCPSCGKDIIAFKWGFGCTGYKEGCKFSVGTICGKTISEANVKKLIEKGSTPIIKGFTSKAGKTFDAKLVLKEDNSIGFEFAPKKTKKEEGSRD